jgi:nucleotide-binding universal stress UspA family protein
MKDERLRSMKRIMAAVDVTPASQLIVRSAVELARAIGARIRLVHVVFVAAQVPPPGVFVPPASFRVHEFTAAAEKFLTELEEEIPEELRDGVSIEVGHPAEKICESSHRYDPDILVIGAHEYGLMSRALGTTAARIVNRADRPVFVVRPLPASHTVAAERSSA